jgi:hypothetical protein
LIEARALRLELLGPERRQPLHWKDAAAAAPFARDGGGLIHSDLLAATTGRRKPLGIAATRESGRVRSMRTFMPLGLILAGLVMSSCGYYVDPAQYRQGSTMEADDPPRRARVAPPAAEFRTSPARTGTAPSDGTIGDGSRTRPLPPGNKAESEQALTRETERASDSAKDLINGICRGCWTSSSCKDAGIRQEPQITIGDFT